MGIVAGVWKQKPLISYSTATITKMNKAFFLSAFMLSNQISEHFLTEMIILVKNRALIFQIILSYTYAGLPLWLGKL